MIGYRAFARNFSRRIAVQYVELELTVGETVRIGDQFLTVIDLDNSELSVRLDPAEFAICDSDEHWPRK